MIHWHEPESVSPLWRFFFFIAHLILRIKLVQLDDHLEISCM